MAIASPTTSANRRPAPADGVGEGAVAGRDEDGRGVGRLLHHGAEELPLPFGAAQVAARVVVSGPDVAQGVLAVEGLAASLEVDPGQLVLHIPGDADIHASEAVNDPGEATEADLEISVDMQTGRLLDGLGEQPGAAEGESRVDLVAASFPGIGT